MSIPGEKHRKLELTWVGKGQEHRLEPRILIEDPELSYGDDKAENLLIQGDNLLALKALEQDFSGKIKCVYIDPPYNTGSAFEHYDDGLEHSLWLDLIAQRLKIIKNLLAADGSLWISIDDNECHYLKVLCDEIFGRANFVANVVWEKKYAASNDALQFSVSHDYILVYSKQQSWRPNKLPRSQKSDSAYKNPDNDIRGPWQSDNYTCNKSITERPNLYYPIVNPNNGEVIYPKKTAVWRYSQETHLDHQRKGLIYWGASGNNSVPRFKRFLSEVSEKGSIPETIWNWEEVGHNQDAKREQLQLNSETPFTTPKPERLLERIITLATNPGDWVLDSFLGSGTTAAVAHKMGRRWIGVELGEHARTHCQARLRKVVSGEQGGISKSVGWRGGGGFRFYRLAPSLLRQDDRGLWVIEPRYNAEMLAAAMAKQAGFRYAPDPEVFWKQGKSSEKDHIYTTTEYLTGEMLDRIREQMSEGESLLVACTRFESGCEGRHANISVKKIPQMLIDKCEFGRDDYSLKNVIDMPRDPSLDWGQQEVEPWVAPEEPEPAKAPEAKPQNPQRSLF